MFYYFCFRSLSNFHYVIFIIMNVLYYYYYYCLPYFIMCSYYVSISYSYMCLLRFVIVVFTVSLILPFVFYYFCYVHIFIQVMLLFIFILIFTFGPLSKPIFGSNLSWPKSSKPKTKTQPLRQLAQLPKAQSRNPRTLTLLPSTNQP